MRCAAEMDGLDEFNHLDRLTRKGIRPKCHNWSNPSDGRSVTTEPGDCMQAQTGIPGRDEAATLIEAITRTDGSATLMALIYAMNSMNTTDWRSPHDLS